jgi:hypothetical protein
MKIEFAAPGGSFRSSETLALPAFEEIGLAPTVEDLDSALFTKVADLMKAGRFKGRLGDTLSFLAPPSLEADAVLVVGATPDAPNSSRRTPTRPPRRASTRRCRSTFAGKRRSSPPTPPSACAWPPPASTSPGPARRPRRSKRRG